MLVALDLGFGGWRHVRARWPVYALMGVASIVYLVWRLSALEPMPPVYLRRPDGPGYALWLVAKLIHYVCCAIWLAPMTIGPTGRFDPFTEVPGAMLLMIGIVVVMGAGYALVACRARGFWIWPMWIVLALLPVVPVLATPHAAYMCGVGFAVAAVLGPGLGRRRQPTVISRLSRAAPIFFLVASAVLVSLYRLQWTGMIAADRLAVDHIADRPPPNDEVTDLFFLNLPFTNIYAKLCLADRWGPSVENLGFHVLTWSPDLVSFEGRCTVTQLDGHRFSLRVDGRPYFSSLLGRVLIEAFRTSGRLRTGDEIETSDFTVRVVEADASGVHELIFAFPEPLASERYAFYLSTRLCPATRIRFRPDGEPATALPPTLAPPEDRQAVVAAAEAVESGQARAAEVLFAATNAENIEIRGPAETTLRRIGSHLAEALGAPVQQIFERESIGPSEWSALRRWWQWAVDDATLDELWVRRFDRDALRERRDEVPNARRYAARYFIRNDLYLTGPPYPGPR